MRPDSESDGTLHGRPLMPGTVDSIEVQSGQQDPQRALNPSDVLRWGSNEVLHELARLRSSLECDRRGGSVCRKTEQHDLDLLGLKRPGELQS